MNNDMPSRKELIEKIADLRSGLVSREAISAWAAAYIDDDSMRITDTVAWEILKNLGAVDLPAIGGDGYLFQAPDFDLWLEKIE